MDKFDRQVRIWGTHGQHIIETSHVCVVGSSPFAFEIVKNLALPGIGCLTMIATNSRDLEQNQFWNMKTWNVTQIDWNAEKMGSDVFWSDFELIIITTGQNDVLKVFRQIKSPPVLLCSTSGQNGFVTFLSGEPHFVVESHPEHTIPDLRLGALRSDLSQFYSEFLKNTVCISDLPFAALLYHACENVLKEKKPHQVINRHDLKDQINVLQNKVSPNTQLPNFFEALRFAHLALERTETLPENVIRCLALKDVSCQIPFNQNVQTLLRALSSFLDTPYSEGQLPLAGIIPDMESSYEMYTALRNAYSGAAENDVKIFHNLVSSEVSHIEIDQVKSFCRNCRHINVIEPIGKLGDFESVLNDETTDSTIIKNVLHSCLSEALKKEDKRRFYPCISFVAGIAAQEAIKVLTHQFLPLHNTLVYEGELGRLRSIKI